MVFNQTQNTSIKNNLIDELKLNPVVDNIPSVVNPTIQPVFEVKKKISSVLGNTAKSTTGSTTLHTTSSTLDTYVTGLTFGLTINATNDIATGRVSITGVINGTTVHIASIPVLTLTAQNTVYSMSFPIPLKLDRNSAVTLGANWTFSAGAGTVIGTLIGYTEETAIKTV